jgi:hypothetical protein
LSWENNVSKEFYSVIFERTSQTSVKGYWA